MSSKKTQKLIRNALVLTAAVVGGGFAEQLRGSMGVTILNHRKLTHRSINLTPWLEAFIKADMKIYSPDPRI